MLTEDQTQAQGGADVLQAASLFVGKSAELLLELCGNKLCDGLVGSGSSATTLLSLRIKNVIGTKEPNPPKTAGILF